MAFIRRQTLTLDDCRWLRRNLAKWVANMESIPLVKVLRSIQTEKQTAMDDRPLHLLPQQPRHKYRANFMFQNKCSSMWEQENKVAVTLTFINKMR